MYNIYIYVYIYAYIYICIYIYVYIYLYACKYYVPGPPHHCLVPSHTTKNTGSSGSSISSN